MRPTTTPPCPTRQAGNWASARSYVHVCTNETIHGVEFQSLPDLKALGSDAPLVIDFSSHVASRPVDWSRVGLAFAAPRRTWGRPA
jgi:phosphoserine aminotransferase